MKRTLRILGLGVGLVAFTGGCSGDDKPVPEPAADPGALIRATMSSSVGVLLDEFPEGVERDRVAAAILAKAETFWHDRATRQARLASVRLVFRSAFYTDPKDALPISPTENWEIALKGKANRRMVGTHDVVAVDYDLTSVMVSTASSPAISEPALGTVGGTWDEPFEFPVDPELMLQRMGYACISESQFPPNSVDAEELDSMYDQTCGVEPKKTHQGCHFTALPTESCIEALDSKVGRITTKVHFERLAYDKALADKHRIGEVTTPDFADLTGIPEQFEISRVMYRFIKPDSCSIVEECVGGEGWRRLLSFTASDKNVGGKPLVIGAIDYYDDKSVASQLIDHGVYELSACHAHYHFMHYGSFEYGDNPNNAKRGFCLQSTNRFSNNEYGPLFNEFASCSNQGVGPGWGDEYRAGIECQWVDVTDEKTKTAPVKKDLTFTSNPDGFLCEGNPVLDANGMLTFIPTEFKTLDGKPVDKPVCDYFSEWDKNNSESHEVALPLDGEGYVTDACTDGQIGPRRNCEFDKAPAASHVLACTPGQQTTLSCTIASGSSQQVVRVCDHSAVLDTGIPCTFNESFGNETVLATTATVIKVTCPAAKSATEPGGKLSIYQGAAFNDDATAAVTCVITP